ncbi:MAG: hydroxymethylglutaryl-CoA reductase, degradative [Anaerolineae bacterium]|nr:hydroxymethylglutaryl-CoA reductase, degradative [Anaerolineae bacterium]NIN98582.1 hydroxymethylglutaryl-CoA reductase, degradative [Anaerolineae bacterium]NIQ81466.1 hydroxymethylglutaryl-CoA reductase, degradative [Anaerolineae bacterium]
MDTAGSSVLSRIPGFYKLAPTERLREVQVRAGLTEKEAAILMGSEGLDVAQADRMSENVVGTYGLPVGIAVNFLINGRDYLVPMAIEEPSVVAAASHAAKLVREGGGFQADASSSLMIGQIQVLGLDDLEGARRRLLVERERLLAVANEQDPLLVSLGGGARELEIRLFPETPAGPMLILHLILDCRDAMGANAINTAAEAMAPLVEEITGGQVLLRILSNLADKRLARADATVPADVLAVDGLEGREVVRRIVQAYALAAVDPYRAATHNKGIMNGIDAVLIATGNDWRAAEAGAHAYAARSGHYTSLSTWKADTDGNLAGILELPLAVGTVGGATRVHPGARVALKVLGVHTAQELAEAIVAVGLAQNLAALRALATEGIQRGHMELHARSMAIAAGARGDVVDQVAARMVAESAIRLDRAEELVQEMS